MVGVVLDVNLLSAASCHHAHGEHRCQCSRGLLLGIHQGVLSSFLGSFFFDASNVTSLVSLTRPSEFEVCQPVVGPRFASLSHLSIVSQMKPTLLLHRSSRVCLSILKSKPSSRAQVWYSSRSLLGHVAHHYRRSIVALGLLRRRC